MLPLVQPPDYCKSSLHPPHLHEHTHKRSPLHLNVAATSEFRDPFLQTTLECHKPAYARALLSRIRVEPLALNLQV